MPVLQSRDYEAVLDAVGRIHDCDHMQRLPRVAMNEVTNLIGADSGIFNYIAPTLPLVVAVTTPEMPDLEQTNERFSKVMPGHPVLRNYIATRDAGAHKLSDFQTEREYHGSPLYRHVYHDIGYEDQLSIALFSPDEELVVISLARASRSFTERDREILNLVRPHVAAAYRRLERMGILQRALADSEAGCSVCSVFVDPQNHPVPLGRQARQWLREFFPGHPASASRLPDPVARWLTEVRRPAAPGTRSRRAPMELIREGARGRLRIRLLPGWTDGSCRMLVLGLESSRAAARVASRDQLTPREIEVLLQAEQGKSNDEIAVALYISPHMVKKHLENIYEKLDVPNRTAAVAALRSEH